MPPTAPSVHASFRRLLQQLQAAKGLGSAVAVVTSASVFLFVGVGVGVSVCVGCGHSSTPSPYTRGTTPFDAGDGSATASLDGAIPPPINPTDSGVGEPGEWGGACTDDGQCDDSLSCTSDSCDEASRRCHFVSDDSACDDGVFCNGPERCIAGIGCRAGEPVACSDNTACTIDSCDETTHDCKHSPRDADGDGDPDGNCKGGGDCNDQDPDISSLHAEICGNGVDDDCDGVVDEKDCESPAYDTCATALDVDASGSYSLSSRAAVGDYAASCVPSDGHYRDLVVALHVTSDKPSDVEVTVTTTSGDVALATLTRCGDASTENACSAGAVMPGHGYVSRLVLHSVPSGVFPLYVFSRSGGDLVLQVDFAAATSAPTNETCGTSVPLEPGVRTVAHLAGTTADATTACGQPYGDLVYDFSLDAPEDVTVYATSEDIYGTPILSLLGDPCSAGDAELTCSATENATVFRRALPAGRYFVSVGATGPSDIDVLLATSNPTTAPPDENCEGSPELLPATTIDVDLGTHEDDVHDGCGVGARDAAYSLTLDAKTDVLLVEDISTADTGSISLALPGCTLPALACNTGSSTPVRVAAHGLAKGEYRVVAESTFGSPVSVTAFTRAATPPTLVPFSDSCDDAVAIPSTGGYFTGNTSNSADDFTASCDVGGANGSRDQMLTLHLDRASRVVLDARGTSFQGIIDVRTGATCPGEEVPFGCSAGYQRDRSYLALSLVAGDYWIQVDGYSGGSGAWALDVFVQPN